MSLRADILDALRRHGLAPTHRLGQNFMVDSHAVQTLVETAAVQVGDHVVEVGPGTGVLTRALLAAGAQVTAVEVDAGMVRLLQEDFAEDIAQGQLCLVHGDALAGKTTLHPAIVAQSVEGPWILAANLPYDASIPIILNALHLPVPPKRVAVTVQLEAAERLCANPGSKAWGASAAVAQAAGQGRIVKKLGPDTFHPRPRVRSAILAWTPERETAPGFPAWVRALFAYRRKVLPRALRDSGLPRHAAQTVIAAAGLDEGQRVETLDVAELVRLFATVESRDAL